VLAEDTAALVGLLLAFLGVLLSRSGGIWYADGIASILIGGTLSAVALILVIEGRKLLVGESARAEIVKNIRRLAEEDPAVVRVVGPLTMHLGPDQILVNLSLSFRSGIRLEEMAAAVDRLDRSIREAHPRVRHVFIDARPMGELHPSGGT
jgi:divalent metal cation (Fe/Co/Zn/Cd) transporter